MAFLKLQGVCKSFGKGKREIGVLKNIDLEVDEGEFIAILGFSGSGKSTLINLIAGLIPASSGVMELAGKPILEAGPDRGVVFQNYSLLPWLSVLDNVLLAVERVFPELPGAEQKEHALKFIDMVNLTPAVEKKPPELSGGMRQRVSVARALAMNPKMLLLDEPLGALDALTRGTLQKELERIWDMDRKTVVMITNDVDEAMVLADRIIPLRPGPNASLGPSFSVNLPRPRDRTALNANANFVRTRNDLVQYLVSCRKEARELEQSAQQDGGDEEPSLPELRPLDLAPSQA